VSYIPCVEQRRAQVPGHTPPALPNPLQDLRAPALPKAIETAYKGYRFRSRLEARWAVFFDRAEIAWEYEPEGFETDAGRYLPDFLLRGRYYVEVKPDNAPSGAFDKARALARGFDLLPRVNNAPEVVLLSGPPEHGARYECLRPHWHPSRLPWEWWGCCSEFYHLGYTYVRGQQTPWPEATLAEWLAAGYGQNCRINQAVQAARSARFEFGETPR
jgi:hypothetical protein